MMAKIAFKNLTRNERKSLKAAARAMERAYAPYSHFRVGAAVLTSEGKIITGTNYEVAAYGDSICAERAALLRANSQGHGEKCEAISIIAKSNSTATTDVTAPCGSCRQLIFEAAQRSGVGKEFKIIMATTELDKIEVSDIGRLLPFAFGPDDLKKANLAGPSTGKEAENDNSGKAES